MEQDLIADLDDSVRSGSRWPPKKDRPLGVACAEPPHGGKAHYLHHVAVKPPPETIAKMAPSRSRSEYSTAIVTLLGAASRVREDQGPLNENSSSVR